MTPYEELPTNPRSLRLLLDTCLSVPRSQSTLIVSIDGRGGAGKSSLAQAMSNLDQTVTIVHIDDFYDPTTTRNEIGAMIDWRRVVEQVLAPLRNERSGRYQRFDWDTQCLAEWHDVPVGGIMILDGVYSTRREIVDYLTYRIWLEIPRELGMERGIVRDGWGSRTWWLQQWMPEEDRYIAEQRPSDSADIIIDGSVGIAFFKHGQYCSFLQI